MIVFLGSFNHWEKLVFTQKPSCLFVVFHILMLSRNYTKCQIIPVICFENEATKFVAFFSLQKGCFCGWILKKIMLCQCKFIFDVFHICHCYGYLFFAYFIHLTNKIYLITNTMSRKTFDYTIFHLCTKYNMV